MKDVIKLLETSVDGTKIGYYEDYHDLLDYLEGELEDLIFFSLEGINDPVSYQIQMVSITEEEFEAFKARPQEQEYIVVNLDGAGNMTVVEPTEPRRIREFDDPQGDIHEDGREVTE